jgi:hypothetical protein
LNTSVSVPSPPSTIEPHAAAVGRDCEVLGRVATIDLGGIDAVAALEEVATVTRIPDHEIIAGPAEHLVITAAANQRVVAVAPEQQIVPAFANERVVTGPAEQLIVARPADQRVVAVAAEQLGAGQRAVGFVERNRVVARAAEHLDQRGVGDGRRTAIDGYRTAVDQDASCRVATGDDRIVETVSENRQLAGAGRKNCRGSHCFCPHENLTAAHKRVGSVGALARSRVNSRGSHGRLEGVLQTLLSFSGDALSIS